MKNHYRGHKMAVWLNLIPQLHQPGDDVSMRHHHFREKGDLFYAGKSTKCVVKKKRQKIKENALTGPVRDEWYTPLPLPGATRTSSSSTTACATTSDEEAALQAAAGTQNINEILDDSKDDAELLQRLASRHYYSTTTALAITVGVGCILLVLNMLIFAGIYYQRDRDKKRAAMACVSNNGQESLAMSSRSPTKPNQDNNPRSSPGPPPSYTTLPKSPSSIQVSCFLQISSMRHSFRT